jgi:drug/metabolite transporter (DMT)-like permease
MKDLFRKEEVSKTIIIVFGIVLIGLGADFQNRPNGLLLTLIAAVVLVVIGTILWRWNQGRRE